MHFDPSFFEGETRNDFYIRPMVKKAWAVQLDILEQIDVNNTKELQEASEEIKKIIIKTPIPEDISTLIIEAYNQLSQRVGEEEADVAIRSSATAEDLPEASFAGQQDTFLHVQSKLS